MQKLKHMIAGALLAVTLSTGAAAASDILTAPTPLTPETRTQSLVTPAGYPYCAAWYRECRYRWSYGWRFRRCLAIRGCL